MTKLGSTRIKQRGGAQESGKNRGVAMIFQRAGSASGLGHVGWAYQKIDEVWICGATENPSGHLGGTGDAKGFWALPYSPADVPAIFGRPRSLPAGECAPYNNYKVVKVELPNGPEAWSKACWCQDRPFEVPCRDCLDDTYDILTAYGVKSLPWPIIAEPNLWFDLIPGHAMKVPRNGALSAEGKQQMPVEGTPPRWRVAGTVEYRELQTLLKKYSSI
jgi:hypothetical protein